MLFLSYFFRCVQRVGMAATMQQPHIAVAKLAKKTLTAIRL
jgi:hypothetical protein